MSKARVDSLEVLKTFRTSLWKFSETTMAALADAEGEIHRTMVWLETEQLNYWETQIRKRHDHVERCKEAYRQKTLYKDAAGTKSSGFDERKALDKAVKALEEAEEKHQNVKRNIRVLQKELQNYTGSVQRFSSDVFVELPTAAGKLAKMEEQLGQYVSLAAPELSAGAPAEPEVAAGVFESMGRGTEVARSPQSRADEIRGRAPRTDVRQAAARAPQINFLATTKPLNGPQRLAIASINVKRNPPAAEQMITIAADLKDSQNIYLHRNSANEQDTGWWIGADNEYPSNELVRASVEQVLATRPDLREVLALPEDFVVLIGDGQIAAVYNSKGKDVWNKAADVIREKKDRR